MFILSELTAGQNMIETLDLVTLNKSTQDMYWCNFGVISHSYRVLQYWMDYLTNSLNILYQCIGKFCFIQISNLLWWFFRLITHSYYRLFKIEKKKWKSLPNFELFIGKHRIGHFLDLYKYRLLNSHYVISTPNSDVWLLKISC